MAYADGRTFAAPYTMDAEAIRLATYAAEREARAILAVSEPGNVLGARSADDLASGWFLLDRSILKDRQAWAATDALVESLAAFVGESK